MSKNVSVTIRGPQASGKTLIAQFVAKQLESNFGIKCEVVKGGEMSGPDHDTIFLQTSDEVLKSIARHNEGK